MTYHDFDLEFASSFGVLRVAAAGSVLQRIRGLETDPIHV